MPEPYRVGFLGAGRMAGLFSDVDEDGFSCAHAPALRRAGGFVVAGVSDPDAARARAFVARWGGVAYDDAPALLEGARPDLVVITAPDEQHVPLACLVLGAPRRPHVLIVEKPPCLDRGGLGALLAAAASAPATRVVVNLTRRFDVGHRAVAAAIAARSFGELVEAAVLYYGGWLHNGVHAVDTVRMLLGDECQVTGSIVGAPGRPGDPCRDVDLRPTRTPGARVALRGFDERAFQLFEIDLRFTGGRVRIEDFGRRIRAERVVVAARGDRELAAATDFDHVDTSAPAPHLYRACAAFLRDEDERVFAGADLASAAHTMDALFDAL